MKKTALIAASLAVIAVLYTASIGPAWALTKRGHFSKQAFQAVYLPLMAFEDHCPGDLLWRYESWWSPKMDIHL